MQHGARTGKHHKMGITNTRGNKRPGAKHRTARRVTR